VNGRAGAADVHSLLKLAGTAVFPRGARRRTIPAGPAVENLRRPEDISYGTVMVAVACQNTGIASVTVASP
jgi:hypothetical protein